MAIQFQPARTLRDVFNAVDPARPLQSGDPRYVDCTAVRGNEDVVNQLFRTIDWSDTVTAQLFTGHRGCGKSTELLRLKDRLERANYAVIYFEADDILDLNDIEYSDILVAIARQVHDGLRNAGVELDAELLEQILDWFAEVVSERQYVEEAKVEVQAEAKLSTPPIISTFAQLMAKVTGQLKTGVESKHNIRLRLDPQITQLIENVNLLLSDGQAKLRKAGKQGLVVIIDNLDRISFRPLSEGQRNTHDALYIEHGEQLRSLRCHLVYTVPIAMHYSKQATVLRGIFPESLILPMVKTRTKDGGTSDEGVQALREILAHRIQLEEVFEEQALDLLCGICGGHPRDLMIAVRYACTYAQARYPRPIDVASVEKAIERLVNEYSRMIPEEHLPLLVRVHKTKRVENDDNHRAMLHNLSVLEYVNGAPPWHDVHPVVLRLPRFREICP